MLSGIFLGGAGAPPPPPDPPCGYDYTIPGGAKPYGVPPPQPGICIPTDAEVAAVGRPWALWATIDVTQASDGEVRYGLVCTGVSGGVGYGLAVTPSAPPTTTIGWQAVSGGTQAGTAGHRQRHRHAPGGRPGCLPGATCSCSAAGRPPRPGPPGCS